MRFNCHGVGLTAEFARFLYNAKRKAPTKMRCFNTPALCQTLPTVNRTMHRRHQSSIAKPSYAQVTLPYLSASVSSVSSFSFSVFGGTIAALNWCHGLGA